MNQNNLSSLNTTNNVTANETVLWTALVTPFTENDTIDFRSLAAIAVKQAEAGNGIVLLGSTGEGLALTLAEKTQIVEFVCQLNLNTPLMVAVGGHNLPEQTAWVDQCNQYAIDAYLLGTPIYAKPGVVGQTQWFAQLLNAAKFPCMLYNVPSRSGIEIPLQTVKNLKDHPNFWAMKEASGDINKFLAYREALPHIALFSGEDGMMPYLANAGAKGLVSVCANAWPEATKRYVELSLASEIKTLFPLWHNAIASLFSVANPIPVKVLMHCQNEISQPNLRAPLTHLELGSTTKIQSFDQQINLWFAEQNLARNSSSSFSSTQSNQVVGA
ncbi:MAG: 4-hydroxy-tetrahydrodipicolinate synthase [Alteromonadaceae bacterium]|nr:4-hydroxy-tetrahydrodipicolinate synthase [Alteromonadaceae bacterium]